MKNREMVGGMGLIGEEISNAIIDANAKVIVIDFSNKISTTYKPITTYIKYDKL